MATLEVKSPGDGSTVAKVKLTTKDELEGLGKRAREAFKTWRKTPLKQRQEICSKWCDVMMSKREEIGKELARQMGRPIRYAPNEVNTGVTRAKYMIHISSKYLADQDVSQDDPEPQTGFKRFLRREPVGVCFVLSPFNYPILVAVNAVIPALLAGNAVVLKHSPFTALVGERFASTFLEAGLPKDVLQAVQMEPDVADAFVRSPYVDFISFTGSVRTGQIVNRAAAESGKLVNVVLELGGKDPAYVMPDADVDFAVENLVDGAMFNSGQCCCGIERIYVHEKIYDEFVKKFVDLTNTYKLGDPLDPETTIGPMVNSMMAKKVREHVKDALACGAKQLVDLKKFPLDKDGTPYVAPMVFTEVDHTMKIMNEETFGPTVGIMKVKSDEEAIKLMNDSEYGLTASIWTVGGANHCTGVSQTSALAIGDEIETGTVYLNRCDYGDPGLAWTGAKYSGRGASMSKYGWDLMTRIKSYHIRIPPKPQVAEGEATVKAAAAPVAANGKAEEKGSYIVVFKKGTTKADVEKAIKNVEASGGTIRHRYDSVFTGFAADVPDSVLSECFWAARRGSRTDSVVP
ncbi:aldehyde dehydrogenase [Hyaloraphidium curvatum]|nr:aldehyde dehydrogenase [Hyaloraphidium curvatum]